MLTKNEVKKSLISQKMKIQQNEAQLSNFFPTKLFQKTYLSYKHHDYPVDIFN